MKKSIYQTCLISSMLVLSGCGGGTAPIVPPSTPLSGNGQPASGALVRQAANSVPKTGASVIQSTNINAGVTTDTIEVDVQGNNYVKITKTGSGPAPWLSGSIDNRDDNDWQSGPTNEGADFYREILIKQLENDRYVAVEVFSKFNDLNPNDSVGGGFWFISDTSGETFEAGAFADGTSWNYAANPLPTAGAASYQGRTAAYYHFSQGASEDARRYYGNVNLRVDFGAGDNHALSGSFDSFIDATDPQLSLIEGLSFEMAPVNWDSSRRAFVGRDVISPTCSGTFDACSVGRSNIGAEFAGTSTPLVDGDAPSVIIGTYGVSDFRYTDTVSGETINGNIIGAFEGAIQP